MPADARDDLAAQQSRLIEALANGAIAPEGFDPAQVETAARALAAKRARSAAKAWPRLAESLGHQFENLFAEYANESRLPPGAEPRDDGRAFAGWVDRRGILPDSARVELVAEAVGRGFPFRIVLFRKPCRWAVALRLPRGRVRVFGGAHR